MTQAPETMQHGWLEFQLERAREQERAHLARELHDELGAILVAAKLDLASLRMRFGSVTDEVDQRFDHLAETLNAGIALKRRVVEGLCPSWMGVRNLGSAVEGLARGIAETSGIRVACLCQQLSLPEPAEWAAYRVVQECLTNMVKYAEAASARVSLLDAGDHALVVVTDDGKGFDARLPDYQGHGLFGMRRRVEACGGRLRVMSAPGRGTRVTASIPRGRSQPSLPTSSA